MTLDDGTIWKNIVTPAKAKVAETLDEYRGNHLYNRLDEHYRRFQSQVGQVVMWDDHEVRDNWYHAQILPAESPYTEKRVAVLAQRARQAFLEHYPVTMARGADAQIYRSVPFGPLVEVFALDMRSLSRRQQREPADRRRAPRPRSSVHAQVALARRRDGAIDGDLEDRRRRHAARCRRGASTRTS